MRIIKYVSSTVDYGICYSFDSNPNLIIFYNANWADNAKDRKSTLGGCFFLKNNVVSQFNEKQIYISLSIVEAEYIVAGSCCTQLLWMKQMLKAYSDLQGVQTLCYDNIRAINILESVSELSHETY